MKTLFQNYFIPFRSWKSKLHTIKLGNNEQLG